MSHQKGGLEVHVMSISLALTKQQGLWACLLCRLDFWKQNPSSLKNLGKILACLKLQLLIPGPSAAYMAKMKATLRVW